MESSRSFTALALSMAALGCSSTTAPDASVDVDAGHADGAMAPEAGLDGMSVLDGTPTPVEGGAPAVRWIGRFDRSNPSQPIAEWSASAMQARFSGTSVSVRLGGANNYFAAVVDGVDQPVITTNGASSYPVATGLAAGTHDVLVVRRDEAFDQPSQLVGFDFGNGGQLLAPPPAATHRLEVIGDSLSVGYGDECTNAKIGFTAATENANIAYGPLAARALGAEIHVVAWSGKGLYQNRDGTMTETMPILWGRTIPTDTTSHWDPSQWVADAVVINLGANDYAPMGDPSAGYQAAYLTFVTQLRGVYPQAFFFCALGPTMTAAGLASAHTAISNVIAMRAAAGDTKLKYVEFPTQNCQADGSGCGCDYHPNAATQQSMATILEGALHDTLGW
jgi:hypothetical protein